MPFTNFTDIEDALRQVMGAFGFQGPTKNAVKVEVTLTFEEAVRGCTKTIAYDAKQLCTRCNGNGGEPGSPSAPCGVCEGRGKVKPLVSLFPLQRDRECNACRGTGTRPVRPCTTCHGEGLIGMRRTLDVHFAAGLDSGHRRKIKGEGNRTHPNKPAGPLIVTVTVREHEFFKRDGDDLLCKVPVSFAQAALGGEIEVRTLDGHAMLRIPPGVQPNTVLRMRGKGAPRAHLGGRGDQLVELTVKVPTELSQRARQLILELADELKEERPSFMRSLRDRLRDRWR
jgi:molecular chaperone DnaJ